MKTESRLSFHSVDPKHLECALIIGSDEAWILFVQETLEEILIPKLEIDAGRKPHIVRYILNKRLRPYVEFRHSLFERVYTISERLAHRMIQTGYKQPSRFGRWCPVKVRIKTFCLRCFFFFFFTFKLCALKFMIKRRNLISNGVLYLNIPIDIFCCSCWLVNKMDRCIKGSAVWVNLYNSIVHYLWLISV